MEKDLKVEEESFEEMGLLTIINDARTKTSTKIKKLISRIDLIFIVLFIFAGIFYYYSSTLVSFIFIFLALMEYIIK